MTIAAETALVNTTAGGIGWWVGGFIIPMLVAFVFLRFAGSPKRKPGTGTVLRILAIFASGFLVYSGYIGAGGQLNPGGLFAVLVTVAWAAKQQFGKVEFKNPT